MKNIKRLAYVAMLVGSLAVFMSSCGMRLNPAQKIAYDALITKLAQASATTDMPASEVKKVLDETNKNLSNTQAGFKIVDKEEGKAIPKGTDEATLKKRFVPEKL